MHKSTLIQWIYFPASLVEGFARCGTDLSIIMHRESWWSGICGRNFHDIIAPLAQNFVSALDAVDFLPCQHVNQICVTKRGWHGSLKYCTTAINGMLAGNYDGLVELFFSPGIHRSFVSLQKLLMVELEFQFMTMSLVSWKPISIINQTGNTGICPGIGIKQR